MDIDDILREVDPTENAIPDETRDLQMLTRAWVAERSAPELLKYASLLSSTSMVPFFSGSFLHCQLAKQCIFPLLQLAHRWPV
jgi:hypothetical protein